MSLSNRKAFFRTRTGKSDANSARIIEGLRKLGHFVVPIRSSDPGVPDLCVYPRSAWTRLSEHVEALGEFPSPVWLEIKTAKGKARDAQHEWHARALNSGARVVVVRTLDEALGALT